MEHVHRLAEILRHQGIKDIVFSPGSRNAPIVLAINDIEDFNTRIVHDERSAGFVALGIAEATNNPVVLCCTSGSALLNYAPAIAEAHYRQIPLIVLSADRPAELVNQGDGQTIMQTNAFGPHVCYFTNLTQNTEDEDGLWHYEREVNQAIIKVYNNSLPVHINLPLREPLYNFEPCGEYRVIKTVNFNEDIPLRALRFWRERKKILVVLGQADPEVYQEAIDYLIKDLRIVVLTENTSNVQGSRIISTMDRCIDGISDNFKPELVLHLGGAVISKKIKQLLRRWKVDTWRVQNNDNIYDTFKSLKYQFIGTPKDILKLPLNSEEHTYQFQWLAHNAERRSFHESFTSALPYCDFKVFDTVLPKLVNSTLHISNSSVIRYTLLYDAVPTNKYYCNRGTSGIDGSTSTAVGIALSKPDEQHLLITGDISFLYDSNALWTENFPSNLNILVINNNGGNIFRIIPGPDSTPYLEQNFEAKHHFATKGIAENFDFNYLNATNEKELEEMLPALLSKKKTILEVVTPSEVSPKILRSYFNLIKENT